MAAEIVTERLRLRPFQVDDLDAFAAYRSDPQIARYQSWDRTYSIADAEAFLASQRGLEFGQPRSVAATSDHRPRHGHHSW